MPSLKTREQFIADARKVHGNRYDYSDTAYIRSTTPCVIRCKEHGLFTTSPHKHLLGYNCPSCALNTKKKKLSHSQEDFVVEARKVHGDKYNYTEVKYEGSHHYVTITCPKHGTFKQKPYVHTICKCGCPHCRTSRGATAIRTWLEKRGVVFEQEKRFADCVNEAGNQLRYDFWLPRRATCIEFDGEQHYTVPQTSWSRKIKLTEEKVRMLQHNDRIKDKYCVDHNIKLLRIRYDADIECVLKEGLYDA